MKIVAVSLAVLLCASAVTFADFTAYNDLAGTSPGNVTAITVGGSGLLRDYASGTNTPVTLQVTSVSTSTDTGALITDYPGGTDAGVEFGTRVNNDGYILYNTADPNNSKVTCVFTGLNQSKRYTLVLTGARGEPTYPNRTTVFTISDVDSFTNTSSAGTTFSGPSDPTDEFNTGDNTVTGHVARFASIAPGSDGDMTVTAGPGPNNGDAMKWYVSQLKLVETTPVGPGSVSISPGQINTVVGKAHQNATVTIPAGSNASSPVSVTLASSNAAVAQPVGATGGALTIVFSAGGTTAQIVPIDIGQAGSAVITTTNDAGLGNTSLNVNVNAGAIAFMPFSMLVLQGRQMPVEVSITAGTNETRAVQVTLTTTNTGAAVPVGHSGGSLVLNFAAGTSNKKTVSLDALGIGNCLMNTTNDGTLTDASMPVEVAIGFNFTVTADQRDKTATYATVAAGMNTWIGGAGVFQVSPGDIDPVPPLRTVIDNAFGVSSLWYPGVGNHEEETAEDMTWIRTEYTSGNNGRTPLKSFTNQDGPAGSVETTYSWNHGNAYFIMLNEYWNGGTTAGSDVASSGDVVPALRTWLSNKLNANTQPAVFVFGHEPAYPFYRHIGDSLDQYPANRDAFWNLLETKNVLAYFCGHTHSYSKYQKTAGKTWQIDVGNAGNFTAPDTTQTFLNAFVTANKVRYDVWDNSSGGFQLAETWSVSITPVPQIALTPTSFTHTVFLGDSLAADTFTVRNSGSTDVMDYSVSVTQGGDWMSVLPPGGSSSGEEAPFTITYNLTGKGVGQYTGVVEVTSTEASNTPQTLAVHLTIETVKPDLDHDSDVDQVDFGLLQACISGDGSPAVSGCEDARLDGDSDVDGADIVRLLLCVSGSGMPAERTCDD